MARVKTKRVYWSPSPSSDVAGYAFYAAPAGDAAFVAGVDAGTVAPLFGSLTSTEVLLGQGVLPEGNWQFAVCAFDASGNFSDPYQATVWQNVPLDLTAPLPPSNGGIN